MKQFAITCCLLPVSIITVLGQVTPDIIVHTRTQVIYTKIITQKNDPARAEMYNLYSRYSTENNIYPNADAIDLVDAYNKQIKVSDVKANPAVFRTLRLPPVSMEMRRMASARTTYNIKPGVLMNNTFIASVERFNRNQQSLSAAGKSTATLNDSLQKFATILPEINKLYEKIPPAQIEFFLISLNDINGLMEQLSISPNDLNAQLTLEELMNDFFEFDLTPYRKTIQKKQINRLKSSKSSVLYLAVYDMDAYNENLPDNTDLEMPNANVYVYTRGADKKWSQDPQPNSFKVYFGANGLKFSLTPGCDTLSFFKYRPSNPASTLPVNLAKGNYCFVLQDLSNGRLYLKPDINLRDNQVIDDSKLIKLCFKAE